MILALAGLHGAGKSHLSSLIGTAFNWRVCVKRDLLHLLYTAEHTDDDWVAWYRELYLSEGPYEVMEKLLRLIPFHNHIILDSVHNLMEWRAIRTYQHDAVLASVIAPKEIRIKRNGPEDASLDIQRVRFWHDVEGLCLAAESEWCFNGAAAPEVQRVEFQSFLSHYAINV